MCSFPLKLNTKLTTFRSHFFRSGLKKYFLTSNSLFLSMKQHVDYFNYCYTIYLPFTCQKHIIKNCRYLFVTSQPITIWYLTLTSANCTMVFDTDLCQSQHGVWHWSQPITAWYLALTSANQSMVFDTYLSQSQHGIWHWPQPITTWYLTLTSANHSMVFDTDLSQSQHGIWRIVKVSCESQMVW